MWYFTKIYVLDYTKLARQLLVDKTLKFLRVTLNENYGFGIISKTGGKYNK